METLKRRLQQLEDEKKRQRQATAEQSSQKSKQHLQLNFFFNNVYFQFAIFRSISLNLVHCSGTKSVVKNRLWNEIPATTRKWRSLRWIWTIVFPASVNQKTRFYSTARKIGETHWRRPTIQQRRRSEKNASNSVRCRLTKIIGFFRWPLTIRILESGFSESFLKNLFIKLTLIFSVLQRFRRSRFKVTSGFVKKFVSANWRRILRSIGTIGLRWAFWSIKRRWGHRRA